MTTDRHGSASCRLVPNVGLTLHPRSLHVVGNVWACIHQIMDAIGRAPFAGTRGAPTGWLSELQSAPRSPDSKLPPHRGVVLGRQCLYYATACRSVLFGSTNAAGAGHDAFAEAATSRRSEEQPTSWSAANALSTERAWVRPRWALTRSEAQRSPTSTPSLSCREPIRNIRWRQRGLDEKCSPDWSAAAPLVGISYLTTTSGMARSLVEFACGTHRNFVDPTHPDEVRR